MNSLAIRSPSNMILQKPVDYLTYDEFNTLKRACQIQYERSKQTENAQWIKDRDTLLMSLMWVTGGRITDCLTFSDEQINVKERTLTFVVKKRKVKKHFFDKGAPFVHTIYLDNETMFEIMEYTRMWNIKGLLFPARKESNKPLTRQAVNKKLNILTELVGIRHIHPHEFRHGIAMYLQGQGVPIEVISYRLAHSSTRITLETYARMSASQERNIIESLGVRLR